MRLRAKWIGKLNYTGTSVLFLSYGQIYARNLTRSGEERFVIHSQLMLTSNWSIAKSIHVNFQDVQQKETCNYLAGRNEGAVLLLAFGKWGWRLVKTIFFKELRYTPLKELQFASKNQLSYWVITRRQRSDMMSKV